MGLVKYNLKNFDDCINKVQTSKRYIKSAENIIEAIYGPLDWKLAIQTGKTYCKILDSIIDINEDYIKLIDSCRKIFSEYEKMEEKINKELNILQTKSLKTSKILGSSLISVGTTIYENAEIQAKENPKKVTAPKEETKKNKKQNFFQRSWNSATKKVKSIGNSVADTACDFGEWMIYEPVGEKWKDIKHIGNGIGKDLKSAGETAVEVGRRGVLTGCNACSGFTWGLADFTEGLYDGLTYIGTGLLTPVTGLVDGGQAIGCLISGNKYDSITVNMWKGASESVKTDIAGYQKEKYYKKNGYGDLLKEDSYAYEAVNKTSETVGYISGAIMTGGAGIQIGTASMAISGIGNGSEDALKSGATIGESIISGAVQGIIDGASYLFGAKLGQKVFGQGSTKFDKVWTKIFGDTATVKSNVANVAIKSGADMADGAINTLAQPTIQKIYRDESYGELFQQNGGYTALFTNMAIAGSLSAASEGLEIKSKSKNIETSTEQGIPESSTSIKSVDEIKKSEIMKKLEVNNNNLIDGIVNKIPKNLDELSKIRAAYLKLSQLTSYSDEYYISKDITRRKEIYNHIYNIENIGNSNKIVCSNWSQMYKDVLENMGIESSKIRIFNTLEGHKYVIVDIGKGKSIVADATDNFGGGTDMAYSKLGQETKGFKIMNTADIDDNMNSKELHAKYLSNIKVVNNSENIISKIDSKIGYKNSEYRKNLDDITQIYQNKDIDVSVDKKINSLKKIFDDKGQSAIEQFPLISGYAKRIFGVNTKTGIYKKNNIIISYIEIKSENMTKYLVKTGGENLQVYDNIDEIINGAEVVR